MTEYVSRPPLLIFVSNSIVTGKPSQLFLYSKVDNHRDARHHDAGRDSCLVHLQYSHRGGRERFRCFCRSDDTRNESICPRIRVRAAHFRTHVRAVWAQDADVPRDVLLRDLPDSSSCRPRHPNYFRLPFLWWDFCQCAIGHCTPSIPSLGFG
jgi:hypothetical protein